MEYYVYISGPAAMLEIRVKTQSNELQQFDLTGNPTEMVPVGDAFFQRGQILAIVPFASFGGRTALGKPG